MTVFGGNHSQRRWPALVLALCLLSLPVAIARGEGVRGAGIQSVRERGRIAAGDAHTCAIASDDVVWCWGDNTYGQLGSSAHSSLPNDRSEVPVQAAALPGGRVARQITSGRRHVCVLAQDGTVWCWGENGFGQSGDAGLVNVADPVQVPIGSPATSVAAGGNSTCAVLSTHAVQCWGRNNRGQLGNGTKDSLAHPAPSDVSSIPADFTVASLDVGALHACAVNTAGDAWCWGAYDNGRLGTNVASDVLTPQRISSLTAGTTSAISAGLAHTCAVAATTMHCFGVNTYGQLGSDATATPSSSSPLTVALSANATVVVTGSEFSCALLSTQAVHCFGRNSAHQLGDGTTTSRHSAQAVSGVTTGAVDVVAGHEHACAALANGLLMCWGANTSGQLGNNSVNNASSAVQVGLLSVSPTTTTTSTSTSTTTSTTTTTLPVNNNANRAPTVTSVVTSSTSSTTVVPRSLRVKRNKSLTARTIASHVSLQIPKTSKGTMRLSIVSGTRNCRFVGTQVRGVRKGTCNVLVTLIPKRGKRVLKTAKIVVL